MESPSQSPETLPPTLPDYEPPPPPQGFGSESDDELYLTDPDELILDEIPAYGPELSPTAVCHTEPPTSSSSYEGDIPPPIITPTYAALTQPKLTKNDDLEASFNLPGGAVPNSNGQLIYEQGLPEEIMTFDGALRDYQEDISAFNEAKLELNKGQGVWQKYDLVEHGLMAEGLDGGQGAVAASNDMYINEGGMPQGDTSDAAKSAQRDDEDESVAAQTAVINAQTLNTAGYDLTALNGDANVYNSDFSKQIVEITAEEGGLESSHASTVLGPYPHTAEITRDRRETRDDPDQLSPRAESTDVDGTEGGDTRTEEASGNSQIIDKPLECLEPSCRERSIHPDGFQETVTGLTPEEGELNTDSALGKQGGELAENSDNVKITENAEIVTLDRQVNASSMETKSTPELPRSVEPAGHEVVFPYQPDSPTKKQPPKVPPKPKVKPPIAKKPSAPPRRKAATGRSSESAASAPPSSPPTGAAQPSTSTAVINTPGRVTAGASSATQPFVAEDQSVTRLASRTGQQVYSTSGLTTNTSITDVLTSSDQVDRNRGRDYSGTMKENTMSDQRKDSLPLRNHLETSVTGPTSHTKCPPTYAQSKSSADQALGTSSTENPDRRLDTAGVRELSPRQELAAKQKESTAFRKPYQLARMSTITADVVTSQAGVTKGDAIKSAGARPMVRSTSIIEEVEKKRRENATTRLKGLRPSRTPDLSTQAHTTARRSSASGVLLDMPVIGASAGAPTLPAISSHPEKRRLSETPRKSLTSEDSSRLSNDATKLSTGARSSAQAKPRPRSYYENSTKEYQSNVQESRVAVTTKYSTNSWTTEERKDTRWGSPNHPGEVMAAGSRSETSKLSPEQNMDILNDKLVQNGASENSSKVFPNFSEDSKSSTSRTYPGVVSVKQEMLVEVSNGDADVEHAAADDMTQETIQDTEAEKPNPLPAVEEKQETPGEGGKLYVQETSCDSSQAKRGDESSAFSDPEEQTSSQASPQATVPDSSWSLNLHVASSESPVNLSAEFSPKSELSSRPESQLNASKEDMSEGRGSLFSTPDPDADVPRSPTISEADSGICSKTDKKHNQDEHSSLKNLQTKVTSHASSPEDRSPMSSLLTSAASSVETPVSLQPDVLANAVLISTGDSNDNDQRSPDLVQSTSWRREAPANEEKDDPGQTLRETRKTQFEETSDSAKTSTTKTVTSTPEHAIKSPGGLKDVSFTKGAVGLGFCIEGGKDSPAGDVPISVKRVFKGSSAAQDVLKAGDELRCVNDTDLSNMSHYAAWNFLKALPEGLVRMRIHRK